MECEKWGRVLFGRDSEPISLTNFFVAPLFPLFYTTLNSLSELSVAYMLFHGSYFQANDLSIANLLRVVPLSKTQNGRETARGKMKRFHHANQQGSKARRFP
jgi:hypothetical protein